MSSNSIVNHPALRVFGLHEIDPKELKWGEFNNSTNTLLNIISWIPIIGAIIGTIHLIAGASSYIEESKRGGKAASEVALNEAKGMIGRGVAAILCFGPILAIIDVVITAARHFINPPDNATAQKS